MNNRRLTSLAAKRWSIVLLVLLVVQVLLVFVSWLITAVSPESHIHSLLSSEGLRWLFGSFVDNITQPFLVWMILVAMAVGTWRSSVPRHTRIIIPSLVWVELAIILAVMLLLTVVPHAILRSVTGSLFPSSFSHSILPVMCITTIICAITIGFANNRLHTLADVYDALVSGLRDAACLVPIYIVATELYFSFRFVIG